MNFIGAHQNDMYEKGIRITSPRRRRRNDDNSAAAAAAGAELRDKNMPEGNRKAGEKSGGNQITASREHRFPFHPLAQQQLAETS